MGRWEAKPSAPSAPFSATGRSRQNGRITPELLREIKRVTGRDLAATSARGLERAAWRYSHAHQEARSGSRPICAAVRSRACPRSSLAAATSRPAPSISASIGSMATVRLYGPAPAGLRRRRVRAALGELLCDQPCQRGRGARSTLRARRSSTPTFGSSRSRIRKDDIFLATRSRRSKLIRRLGASLTLPAS